MYNVLFEMKAYDHPIYIKLGSIDEKNLSMYPSENNDIPECMLIEDNVLDTEKIKEIQKEIKINKIGKENLPLK